MSPSVNDQHNYDKQRLQSFVDNEMITVFDAVKTIIRFVLLHDRILGVGVEPKPTAYGLEHRIVDGKLVQTPKTSDKEGPYTQPAKLDDGTFDKDGKLKEVESKPKSYSDITYGDLTAEIERLKLVIYSKTVQLENLQNILKLHKNKLENIKVDLIYKTYSNESFYNHTMTLREIFESSMEKKLNLINMDTAEIDSLLSFASKYNTLSGSVPLSKTIIEHILAKSQHRQCRHCNVIFGKD